MLKTEAEKDRLRRELRQRCMVIISAFIVTMTMLSASNKQKREQQNWSWSKQQRMEQEIKKDF